MKVFFSTILFIAICCMGSAHSEEVIPYGDWTFVKGDSYKNIHTLSPQKLELGYWCNRDCTFYISPALICQMGKVTDGWLLQSNGVGIKVNTMCIKNEIGQVLQILGGDEIVKTLQSTKTAHFLINFDIRKNSLMSFDLIGFKDAYNRIQN